MSSQRQKALADLRRAMKWIVALAVVIVIGALASIAVLGELSTHVVVATVLGVFLSTLLGCGLFALAFFSDKSGHDDDVTDATRNRDDRRDDRA